MSILVQPGSGVPKPQNITGQLLDVNGNPIGDVGVVVTVTRPDGGKDKYWPVTGIATGSWGVYGYVVVEGTYSFLAEFDGGGIYEYSRAETSATFTKVQAVLSIAVSPASGYAPLPVKVSGYLTRGDTNTGLGGRTVKIYRNDVLFADLASSIDPVTLGYYEVADTLGVGTHSYYASFLGDDQFTGCEEAEASSPPEMVKSAPLLGCLFTVLASAALLKKRG